MPNFSSEQMDVPSNLLLASWTDRFLAWLIDFIIVSIGLAILFAALSLPFWFDNNMIRAYKSIEPLHYLISSIVFLGYWTYFEFKTGQSIGKRLLHLRTTDLSGKLIDVKTAAIESFGKSFLLPFDVVLGWISTNKRRQRIFSRISNTIVIKLKEDDYGMSNNVKYLKD
jgi:uncharacterized RDD family membrane protein YckC